MKQWCCFKIEKRNEADEKPTKVPYHPSGYRASSKKPESWSDYRDCQENKGFSGIGFFFNGRWYSGIDLDNCVKDGIIAEWAVKLIKLFDTYTEFSTSGTGIHMIIRGMLPEKIKDSDGIEYIRGRKGNPVGTDIPKGALELYSERRFFVFTGNQVPGTPSTINERESVLLEVLNKYFIEPRALKNPSKEQPPQPSGPVTLDDNALWEKMFHAKNGTTIFNLYQGDCGGYYDEQGQPDESAADQAIANHLAYYTQKDHARIERMMLQTGLAREKWQNHPTYLARTIERAISDCSCVYDQNYGKHSIGQEDKEEMAPEVEQTPEQRRTDQRFWLDTLQTQYFVDGIRGGNITDYEDIYRCFDGEILTFVKLAVKQAEATGRLDVVINTINVIRTLPEGKLIFADEKVGKADIQIISNPEDAPPLDFQLPEMNLENSLFMQLKSEYCTFSEAVSPESYKWFHEAGFWWLLSLIAARRIKIILSTPMYTNIYVAPCAKSTLWRKSSATVPVEMVLRQLSLRHLMHKGTETPEYFVQQASGTFVPANYADLDFEQQEAIRQKLSWAGLGGVFVDELGPFLQGTRNISGHMALWRQLFLEWHACPPDWDKATKGSGSELVKRPYLTIFGCFVPDNFNNKQMESILQDGTVQRINIITPPEGTSADVSTFTDREEFVPQSVVSAINEWNQRLIPPKIKIVTLPSEKKGEKPKFSVETVQPLEATPLRLSKEARDIWHAIRVANKKCAANLSSNAGAYYDRRCTDLIKMAGIAASIEAKDTIEGEHIAMAYPFFIEARNGYHRFLRQAAGTGEKEQAVHKTDEDKILKLLREKGEKTEREISQYCNIKDRKKLHQDLQVLVHDGLIRAKQGKRVSSLIYSIDPEAY